MFVDVVIVFIVMDLNSFLYMRQIMIKNEIQCMLLATSSTLISDNVIQTPNVNVPYPGV